MKRFRVWFTRERRLILAAALYTASMVYTRNIVSYLFAAAFVTFLIVFNATPAKKKEKDNARNTA